MLIRYLVAAGLAVVLMGSAAQARPKHCQQGQQGQQGQQAQQNWSAGGQSAGSQGQCHGRNRNNQSGWNQNGQNQMGYNQNGQNQWIPGNGWNNQNGYSGQQPNGPCGHNQNSQNYNPNQTGWNNNGYQNNGYQNQNQLSGLLRGLIQR